jgi:plastocyanin
MKLDRLPVGEGLVGFLLVVLLVTFVLARGEIGNPGDSAADGGEPTASAEPTDGGNGELEITMTDNKFDQTELTAKADTAVSIPLTNNGAAIHNVHVADATGNYSAAFCTTNGADPCSDPARLAGGATGTLDFTLPAGEYDFRCDYHATEMNGTLTVE